MTYKRRSYEFEQKLARRADELRSQRPAQGVILKTYGKLLTLLFTFALVKTRHLLD
jgi:hypothetical protein